MPDATQQMNYHGAGFAEALAAFERGNLYIAEALTRYFVRQGLEDPRAFYMLAHVAEAAGEPAAAAGFLRRAHRFEPSRDDVANHIAYLEGLAAQKEYRILPGTRYLVIKAFGHGFCADVNHVLSCLLLAEMTGRVPVIDWGTSSRFCNAQTHNAWNRYFEPVSPVSTPDLVGRGHDYFPPQWSDEILDFAITGRAQCPWACMPYLAYLNRPEAVAVVSYHVALSSLLPWLPASHRLAGAAVDRAFRDLVARHLRPSAEVRARVEAFAQERMQGRRWGAVHARGGDKVLEDHAIHARTASFHHALRDLMERDPGLGIFLLTDSVANRDDFAARYPGRVVTTDCTRTPNEEGVHYLPDQPDREALGLEVITDVYLAGRCDYLCAAGTSNVGLLASYLKEWAPGTLVLSGESAHEQLFLSLFAD